MKWCQARSYKIKRERNIRIGHLLHVLGVRHEYIHVKMNRRQYYYGYGYGYSYGYGYGHSHGYNYHYDYDCGYDRGYVRYFTINIHE